MPHRQQPEQVRIGLRRAPAAGALSWVSLCGMDGLPDDAADRRIWLERWAAEQRRRMDRRSAGLRLRTAVVPVGAGRLARGLRVGTRVSGWLADRMFDRGLETSGNAFEPEHAHPDRIPYLPSAWHVLPRALRYLGVSDDDTFVDFGCGKGRVVHQAARWPFRRVIGVEISPVLAEIARTAVAARSHQHRCGDVQIVASDVTEFRVPDDLTIGYFYHPFESETFDVVLRGIVDSIDRHPRRVRLIYVRPWNRTVSQVLATKRFRLLKELRRMGPGAPRVVIFESR